MFSETASTNWRIFSHRPDESALSQQEFVESARYKHERDHLLRTLTTSWGLVRHLLMSLLFSDCLHFLDSADSDLFRETAQLQPGRPGRVWQRCAARVEMSRNWVIFRPGGPRENAPNFDTSPGWRSSRPWTAVW